MTITYGIPRRQRRERGGDRQPRVPQDVAGAALRLDEDRLAKLAAEIADVDLDEIVVEGVAPEPIEDRLL